MTRLAQLRADRVARLQALGPQPPWWRPWSRREWKRKAVAILTVTAEEVSLMVGEVYARVMETWADQPNPTLAWTNKAKEVN